MEYLDNIKAVHIFENVPLDSIKQILHATAVLEALSLRFTQEERDCFSEKPFTEIFGEFFQDTMLKSLVEMLRKFGNEELTDKADEIENILPDLLDLESAERLPDKIGMQRVLCHGDLWSMNILWRENEKHLDLAALIDYQTAHMGCPASDLIRVFSSCLSGKDRRMHWEKLVEEFYGYLEEEVGDAEMPYTLEQVVSFFK
ncbi:hypothetical protein ANCCAN_10371 [Ancylostoma caninum]|uniref:CHK kinase-like domain-containing protein n=1 Tax=Ancylostoma caninum TaxID=29170 RepID=A0A368GKL9_ANCCA|nr:hypothetical protein ANCCAN_10371 [Ancylostoma caninum]